MTPVTRNGKRWTVNECIQLQREFELLQLSVAEIAVRHKRTPNSIMYKLDQDGLADYNVLYSNHYDLNTPIPSQLTNKYGEEDDDVDNISDDEEQEDDQEYIPEDEDDTDNEEDVEYDDDLKAHVMRLEKQVIALTEMFMNSSKNKSVFSLFA